MTLFDTLLWWFSAVLSYSPTLARAVGLCAALAAFKTLAKREARRITPRHVPRSLSTCDITQVQRKAKLRSKEGTYRTFFDCRERSEEEREAFKEIWEELKEKRKADPEEVFFIRNNNIVSSDKNSVSGPPD